MREPHFISARPRQPCGKPDRCLALVRVVVVDVTFANEILVKHRRFPLANLHRIGIIDHDARELSATAGLGCLEGLLGLLDLGLQRFNRECVLFDLLTMLVARRQRHAVPRADVLLTFALERDGALEDSGQCVVVLGGNRVELVIVAAGASERQPQEGSTNRVDLFVNNVRASAWLCRVR